MKLEAALLLVLAICLHVSLVTAKNEGPCSALKIPNVPKSKTFDLSPLVGQTFTATVNNGQGRVEYTWSVCGTVPCGNGGPAGVCQQNCPSGEGCLKPISATDWDPANVVTVAPPAGVGIGIQETNTFVRPHSPLKIRAQHMNTLF